MEPIYSFALTGAMHENGTLSLTAHIGEGTSTRRVECALRWEGLETVPAETNLPDWLLGALERAVEMFHTHEVLAFYTENLEIPEYFDEV